MRKTLVICIFVCFKFITTAQNLEIYNLNNHHQYLFNPAAAGADEKSIVGFSMKANNISNDKGYPEAYALYGFSKLKNEKFTVGGILFYEKIGFQKTKGGAGTFAFHLPLKNEKTLSFGISVFASELSFNGNWATSDGGAYNDVQIPEIESRWKFNTDLGIMLRNKKYFAGISSTQLFATNISLNSNYVNYTRRQYFGTFGYKLNVSETINFEPSFLLRFDEVQGQLDIRIKAYYKNLIWTGIAYDLQNTATAMLGIKINRYQIGYVIHNNFSQHNSNYSALRHEIMLKVNLINPDKAK